MKYINLINRFWQLHNEQAFQPGESHLYYCILNLFSSKGKNSDWPEELKLTDGSLANAACVDVKFVERNRPKLEARGLLKTQSGGQGTKGGRSYWLADEQGTFPKTSPKMGEVKPTTSPETSPILGEVNNSLPPQPPPQHTTEPPPKEGKSLIYNEFQTIDPDLDSLSHKKNAGEQILEVEAEEVPSDALDADAPIKPPPSGSPPIDEGEHDISPADMAEITGWVTRLASDRNLIGMLSRLNKLRGKEAQDWIERFVIRQWGGKNLNRDYKDIVFHCQSWIETQLLKQANHDTGNQTKRQPRAKQTPAQTGSELDELAQHYFGH